VPAPRPRSLTSYRDTGSRQPPLKPLGLAGRNSGRRRERVRNPPSTRPLPPDRQYPQLSAANRASKYIAAGPPLHAARLSGNIPGPLFKAFQPFSRVSKGYQELSANKTAPLPLSALFLCPFVVQNRKPALSPAEGQDLRDLTRYYHQYKSCQRKHACRAPTTALDERASSKAGCARLGTRSCSPLISSRRISNSPGSRA
jgi:hypothetical protein